MTIIAAFPSTLANGTNADATQVMTLLNWIQSQTNSNAFGPDASGNLALAGKKVTGLGAGAVNGDSVRFEQLNFLQSGADAVTRTLQDKARESTSVKDFTSNSFTSAIAKVVAAGGGEVLVPPGTYTFTATVTIPQNVEIVGDGHGSIIQPGAALTSLFNVTGGLSAIRGLNIQNSGGLSTYGITVSKSADNLDVFIERNYIASFTQGLRWVDGDLPNIFDNTFNSNGVAIVIVNDGRGALIHKNYILGSSGISLRKGAQGPEGVSIFANRIVPGNIGAGAYCIDIQAGLEIYITNNILDQIVQGNAVQIDGSVNSVDFVKFLNNYVGRQLAAANANYGIYAYGAIRELSIVGCTFVGWRQAGIYLVGTAVSIGRKALISVCDFYNADPNLRDIQLDYNTDVTVANTNFTGTANVVEGTACTGRVDACGFSVLPSSVALKFGVQLYGLTTINSGSSNCPQTTKVVTITHGVDVVPLASDIVITPTAFAVNDPGEFIITAITTTQFTVTCRNDPGAGGAAFRWGVDVSR